MSGEINHPDPGRNKILSLYAAFGAALIFSVIPLMAAAFLSLVMIFGVLMAAYILRSGSEADSLLHNHMTFTIRTIWIGSLVALITTTAGGLWLFYTVDNTPLDPCIGQLLSLTNPEAMLMDPEYLYYVFSGCFHNYMNANLMAFIVSAIIAAVPPLIYFLARFARGLSRALDGYRVANPKAWF